MKMAHIITKFIYWKSTGLYTVYDYSTSAVAIIETLSGVTGPAGGGRVGILADQRLVIPVGGTNTP